MQQGYTEQDHDGPAAEVTADNRCFIADQIQQGSDHDHKDKTSCHARRQYTEIRCQQDNRRNKKKDRNRKMEQSQFAVFAHIYPLEFLIIDEHFFSDYKINVQIKKHHIRQYKSTVVFSCLWIT